MADTKASQEEEFRNGLEGLIEIAERLSSHVKSVEDMVEIIKLALTNGSQLKILMAMTLPQQGKR
jgi:hypothetical protein